MRWMRGAAVLVAAVLLLSSCSAPAPWAARLNDDGTVDFLDCFTALDEIEVDYMSQSEYQSWDISRIEWGAEATVTVPVDEVPPRGDSVDVVYYAKLPPDWTELSPPAPAPDDWYAVRTTAGTTVRGELSVGEWVWFQTKTWAWIPEGLCEGWELGPDGEPRRTA